jgi:MFS family permease
MRLRVVGRILLAQGLSSAGTSMSTVALAIMVYAITGSVLQMGGILAAATLPLVVTAWIGGAFLDRYNARNVMVLADGARAVLIFAMPFVAQRAVGMVYVVAALMGVFSAVFNPGQIKIVSELVEREHLVKVDSYLGVARDGAELVGYLLGGVLASIAAVSILGATVTGYTLTFIIDAISYVLSGVLLLGLPRGAAHEGPVPRIRTLAAESPAVLGRLWRHPALRTNLLLALFATGAMMMYLPNSYGLALEVFDAGSLGLAAMEVFVGAGLIVGGLLFSRSSLKGDKNVYVFFSLAGVGACLLAVSVSSFFWLSVVLLALAGAASVGIFVPSMTLYQQIPATPDKGRLISLRSGFGQLGAAVGLVVGGLLGAKIGIKPAFFAAGAAVIVIATVVYLPYRLGASRRAKSAWDAALEAGATRSRARLAAQEAAYSGLTSPLGGPGAAGSGAAVWVAAAAEAAKEAEAAGVVGTRATGADLALDSTGSD